VAPNIQTAAHTIAARLATLLIDIMPGSSSSVWEWFPLSKG
jgi:hypothetical protein